MKLQAPVWDMRTGIAVYLEEEVQAGMSSPPGYSVQLGVHDASQGLPEVSRTGKRMLYVAAFRMSHMCKLCQKHNKQLSEGDFCAGRTQSLHICMVRYFWPRKLGSHGMWYHADNTQSATCWEHTT